MKWELAVDYPDQPQLARWEFDEAPEIERPDEHEVACQGTSRGQRLWVFVSMDKVNFWTLKEVKDEEE